MGAGRPDDADPDRLRHQHRARRSGSSPSVVDPSVLLAIFSGTQIGAAGIDMAPFITALHIAFAVGVVASLLGAVVSASRGGTQVVEDEVAVQRRGGGMTSAMPAAG